MEGKEVSASEWCYKQYEASLVAGRKADAEAYLEMIRVWEQRENKNE